jgi:hypothetical protein
MVFISLLELRLFDDPPERDDDKKDEDLKAGEEVSQLRKDLGC